MTSINTQVKNIGLRIIVTVLEDEVAKDISSATNKKIILRSSLSQAGKVRTALFVTDGTDGKLYYDTVAGDIDVDGVWKVQTYYEMTTFKGYTEAVEIFLANLNLVESVA